MVEFYEKLGQPPKYLPINGVTRKYWIVFLGRCIDIARKGMWD